MFNIHPNILDTITLSRYEGLPPWQSGLMHCTATAVLPLLHRVQSSSYARGLWQICQRLVNWWFPLGTLVFCTIVKELVTI